MRLYYAPRSKTPQSTFRTFSLLGQLGFVMVACVLTGGAGGFALQNYLGWKTPWLSIAGVILGVLTGLRQTYRLILKTLPEERPEDKEEDKREEKKE